MEKPIGHKKEKWNEIGQRKIQNIYQVKISQQEEAGSQ